MIRIDDNYIIVKLEGGPQILVHETCYLNDDCGGYISIRKRTNYQCWSCNITAPKSAINKARFITGTYLD